MIRRRFSYGLAAVFLMWGGAFSARASVPATVNVTLTIHNVPGDSESGISLLVTLNLSSINVIGNAVSWRINEAEFSKPLVGGGSQEWNAELLTPLESLDGLWWVNHEDPEAPKASDFTPLPTLDVRAVAKDSRIPDLLFHVEAGVSDEPPFPYGDRTAYSKFIERIDGSACTCEDCTFDCLDDEPIEIDSMA